MNKIINGFIVSTGLMAGSAFAAVPVAVTDAITDAGADAATVAGAVLVAVLGLLAFHWMRRETK